MKRFEISLTPKALSDVEKLRFAIHRIMPQGMIIF